MQPFFGSFNLGGWEIVLILALILVLFGSKKLPEIAKGLGQGLLEFRKRIDDEATEAGRSLGGIYGKAAAEALTPDNQVAELYDPAVLQKDSELHKRGSFLAQLFAKIMARSRRLLRLKHSTS